MMEESRPIGACGLKQYLLIYPIGYLYVAPHRGVWIETQCSHEYTEDTDVAPHRGVWIETYRLRDR